MVMVNLEHYRKTTPTKMEIANCFEETSQNLVTKLGQRLGLSLALGVSGNLKKLGSVVLEQVEIVFEKQQRHWQLRWKAGIRHGQDTLEKRQF